MPTPRLTEEDFKRNNWQKLTIDQIKQDDQLYKTLDVENNDWWVGDAYGNLVPASVVNKWLNSYDRQTPYQEQNDIATAREVELAQQHRKNATFNKQLDLMTAAMLSTPLIGIGGATALPYLLPGTIGGNIIGTTAFGEALNHAIKYGTGRTMGEHLVNTAHYLGIPESQWGDYGIQLLGDTPIYLGGDLISKAITNAGRTLGREALQQMALNKSYFSTTKDLAKTINPDQKVNVSEIIENNPYQIISEQRLPYLEFDGKVTREVPPSELYERALSKIPKDLIFETTEPNFIFDPTDPEGYYFVTKNEMDPGPFNKEFGEETLRRLKNLGVDINQPAPYEIGSNTVVISPKKYITDEVSKRLYLGFDPYHDNYGGFHHLKTNKSYVELTSGIPKASTVFHEQNMHGTEKLIEGVEKYYGIDTKRLYENTLKNMLEGVDLSKYPDRITNVDKWSEFRASVGEVIKKLHYQLRGKGNIIENVQKFEADVDRLTTEELANLFDSLKSSYGSFYAAMIRKKKHLTPQIKQLLKYAPEVAAPVIGSEQLNQSTSNRKGGKIILKNI